MIYILFLIIFGIQTVLTTPPIDQRTQLYIPESTALWNDTLRILNVIRDHTSDNKKFVLYQNLMGTLPGMHQTKEFLMILFEAQSFIRNSKMNYTLNDLVGRTATIIPKQLSRIAYYHNVLTIKNYNDQYLCVKTNDDQLSIYYQAEFDQNSCVLRFEPKLSKSNELLGISLTFKGDILYYEDATAESYVLQPVFEKFQIINNFHNLHICACSCAPMANKWRAEPCLATKFEAKYCEFTIEKFEF